MAAPHIHAVSSAKKFGGKPEDYISLHKLLDSSKEAFPSTSHRCLTHNSWFIVKIIPLIFGDTAKNSDGRNYIPKDVAEQHVLEDYRGLFIPTPQDFLENLTIQPWMNNAAGGQMPNSVKGNYRKAETKKVEEVKEHEPNKLSDYIDGEKQNWQELLEKIVDDKIKEHIQEEKAKNKAPSIVWPSSAPFENKKLLPFSPFGPNVMD